MAEYQITYWRDIPAMVTAREGRRNSAKVELTGRFQVAIDEAAMRLNLVGTDAYLEQWRRGEWVERPGAPDEVAKSVATEVEAEYSPGRIRTILGGLTPQRPQNGAAPAHGPLLNWLAEGRVILGDGAMGTMLQQAGLTDGGAPELWNVTHPERVQAVYQAYIDAGSNLIETNTFGGTSARLKLHNLQDRVIELNRAGAALAVEVAHPRGVLVAGSIGPSGDMIEPVGPVTVEEAEAIFAEQVVGLVEGGVDLAVIETMYLFNEVRAAVNAVRKVAPDLLIVTTLSFDTNLHTMMGISPREAVETLSSWGVRVVGANCGTGTNEMEIIATQLAQYRPPGVYLMVQSNSGMPQYANGKIEYAGTPEVMAEYAVKMRDLGINIIGACCGSSPAHISAMRAALERVKEQPVSGPPAPSEGVIESAENRAARAAARRSERRQRVLE
jgi:5-methyltetrahydrofolate--homocysteine methyltransferase